ncbi:hypothetical protein [Azospirillum tabaci]|uniref:hypothetical protein n=1 Tax=Azospirillum tabaci TaxID=2752310 RepID=UPI00166009D0|nr:hypothetical protein [Azospirillum tabaci]
MNIKVVRLLRRHRSNNAGEICGFPQQEADALIASGCAMPLREDGQAEEATDGVSGSDGNDAPVADGEGGEPAAAPAPTPSGTGRTIVSAGKGLYHVVADGSYLTPKPLPKAEAEALAAQG